MSWAVSYIVNSEYKSNQYKIVCLGDSDDAGAGEATNILSLQPDKLQQISTGWRLFWGSVNKMFKYLFAEDSVTPSPDKDTNTFFNPMLLKSPQCDEKLEVS